MIYLTQYLAKTYIGSRRQAEKLIRQGKVKVNEKIANLGDKVSGEENIKVNNKEINIKTNQETDVIMLNKPVGYTCTKKTFLNEKNIYSLLPKKYENYIIIGRLDKDSQGLLLLTNNGFLANKISHPKNEIEKKYLIRLAKNDRININQKNLYKKIRQGVKTKEGETLKAKNIYKQEDEWLVIISEGKKRHIRRMFMAMGLKVIYLKRIAISNIELKNLASKSYRNLNNNEINKFNKI
jgi:23S rRNA pseudouridine2605 synthase